MIDAISEEIIKNVIKGKDERIKELERQLESLNKWIEDHKNICPFIESDIHKDNQQEDVMTTEESEYHIRKIEMYSDIFSYGREEKKMAESL